MWSDPEAVERYLAGLGAVPVLCGVFGFVGFVGVAAAWLRRAVGGV